MNFAERLADIRARMREEKLDVLVGVHDGGPFIEKPNPVMVLSGFKSISAAAAILRSDATMAVVVTPQWDAERAGECCPDARIIAADDVVAGVLAQTRGKA